MPGDDRYFSDPSVELPEIDLGEDTARRIAERYPERREYTMGVRLDHEPLQGDPVDARDIDELEEAVDHLEEAKKGPLIAWNDTMAEDRIQYERTLKKYMKQNPEHFEIEEIVYDPELQNREVLEENMQHILDAAQEIGLDTGYNEFLGFSYGGFNLEFIDEDTDAVEQLRYQNPRFTARFEAPKGNIVAGYIPSLPFEGSGLEFGVRARPDPNKRRAEARMMKHGLDPEDIEDTNIEEDARELADSLEERIDAELEEDEIEILEGDPLMK